MIPIAILAQLAVGVDALEPGVQVAVVLLGLREQPRRRGDELLELGLRRSVQLPARRLERLVDVGVGERQAAEVAVRAADDAAQVVDVAALLDVRHAVRQRRVAVDVLPGAEQARGMQARGAEGQRAHADAARRPRSDRPVTPGAVACDGGLGFAHDGAVALLHACAPLLSGRFRQLQKSFSVTLITRCPMCKVRLDRWKASTETAEM
jgi:hypothetical protein